MGRKVTFKRIETGRYSCEAAGFKFEAENMTEEFGYQAWTIRWERENEHGDVEADGAAFQTLAECREFVANEIEAAEARNQGE